MTHRSYDNQMEIPEVRIVFTLDQAEAILAALDGYEPDTASYMDTGLGWSPDEVDDLNVATDALALAVAQTKKWEGLE